MKLLSPNLLHNGSERGSLLIIVLWIAFGLVSVALYFANTMSMELHAADNRVANMEADQAIEGAAVYVSNVLATVAPTGLLPDPATFKADGVKVGDATFWLIGRDTNDAQVTSDTMTFGLVDEASKVNLNTATADMLVNLPQMTQDLASNIYTWAHSSGGGASSQTYSMLSTPYTLKGANFETTEELMLVYGMDMDLLYGEDANLNGSMEPNENDGTTLPPMDNQDGILDPGLLEYTTVYTSEPTNNPDGTAKTNVDDINGLSELVTSVLGSSGAQYMAPFEGRAGGAGGAAGGGGGAVAATPPTSLLQFYVVSGMPESDFMQIETNLVNGTNQGMININTASETALACIPGIGLDNAAQVLAFRQANPSRLTSIAWIKDAMSLANNPVVAGQIGPYITGHSYQFTADVAAVGHEGRGYRRVKFVFDCSSGVPQIIYREDLTHLGWALGKKIRDQLLAQK